MPQCECVRGRMDDIRKGWVDRRTIETGRELIRQDVTLFLFTKDTIVDKRLWWTQISVEGFKCSALSCHSSILIVVIFLL